MIPAKRIAVEIGLAAFLSALAVGAVVSAVMSESALAAVLAVVGFAVGLLLGSRTSGRPPSETTASPALLQWMIPIAVIGGLFIVPAIDRRWPGFAFGVVSIICTLIVGYLIANMIQTYRYRIAHTRVEGPGS